MIRGNVLSDGLEDVVVTLINWGYPIEKDSTGVYVMLSKGKIFVVNHPGFTTISTTTFVDVLAKSFQSVVNFGKNNEKEKCQEIP